MSDNTIIEGRLDATPEQITDAFRKLTSADKVKVNVAVAADRKTRNLIKQALADAKIKTASDYQAVMDELINNMQIIETEREGVYTIP